VAQALPSSPPPDVGTLPWFAPASEPDRDQESPWSVPEPGEAVWPVILLHSALTLAGTGLSWVVTDYGLGYDWLTCAVITFCTLSVTFGPLGVFLSWAAGTEAVGVNLAWGCGLVAVAFVFFAACGVLGMLTAVIGQVVLAPGY
jgi:hypothetical protein